MMIRICFVLLTTFLFAQTTFAERNVEKVVGSKKVELKAADELFDESSPSGLNVDAVKNCIKTERKSHVGASFCTDLTNYASNVKKIKGAFDALSVMEHAKANYEENHKITGELKALFDQNAMMFPNKKGLNDSQYKQAIVEVMSNKIMMLRATLKALEQLQANFKTEFRTAKLTDENLLHLPTIEEIAPPAEQKK
jgi:hypothetical protein